MRLRYRIIELDYEFTFTISRHSHSGVRNVIVELDTEEHGRTLTGLGEAVPSSFYGEDADTVCAFYDRLLADGILDDLGPFDIQQLEARLSAIPGFYGAKSAIDQAFYDLQGKLTGLPVWKLWGLDPAQAPKSSYTIGIADLDEVKRKTEIALSRGYDVLKVKLGTPNDVPLLEAVRGMAPDVMMYVDANAAWDVEAAIEICRFLAGHRVEFVEEPLKLTSSEEDYARLKAEAALPLMADESCHTLADIPRCARYFHHINLKHTKTGGLSEARRMIHAARAHGMKVMLGGFGETSLSVTAFAQLSPLVDYCDLDGALLMATDPYDGIRWEGSRFYLPDRPGLGVVERVT